jgi:hypothetical protein
MLPPSKPKAPIVHNGHRHRPAACYPHVNLLESEGEPGLWVAPLRPRLGLAERSGRRRRTVRHVYASKRTAKSNRNKPFLIIPGGTDGVCVHSATPLPASCSWQAPETGSPRHQPASFVNVFVSEADVRNRNSFFPNRRSMLIVGARPNLAPLLCRIVFVGKPSLGCAFDVERIGLRMVDGRKDFVVRGLRFCRAGMMPGCILLRLGWRGRGAKAMARIGEQPWIKAPGLSELLIIRFQSVSLLATKKTSRAMLMRSAT